MSEEPEKKLYIIVQTPIQSWISDAGSYLLALGLILPGVFLESSAMQWLGFFMFIAMLCAKFGVNKSVHRVRTFAEAHSKLDELSK